MRAATLLASGLLAVLASACGGEDFENKPRPSLPLELTGVIQSDEVTISPDDIGAGPIRIVISNQDNVAHTVTLEGEEVQERVGPVQPQDTATIQETLREGTYEVRAGSSVATPAEIEPGRIVVGPPRDPSNDDVLQP